MVETRKDYRKKQRQQKFKNLWNRLFKKSEKDNDEVERNASVPESETIYPNDIKTNESVTVDEKIDRLKKRLNWAILIVLGLIILVLIALFKLY